MKFIQMTFYWTLIILGYGLMFALVAMLAIPFLILLAAIGVFMLPFILMGA